MSSHYRNLARLHQRLDHPDFALENPADLKLCVTHLVHAADISHSLKSWSISEEWCLRVCEEFNNQGDLERHYGWPLSPNMDRYSYNVAVSQVEFIDTFVTPTFQAVARYLPDIGSILSNIQANRTRWLEQEDAY